MCGCGSSQTQQNIYFKAGRRIACPAGKSRKKFFKRVEEGDREGDDCVSHDVSIRSCLNDNRSSRTYVLGKMEVSSLSLRIFVLAQASDGVLWTGKEGHGLCGS